MLSGGDAISTEFAPILLGYATPDACVLAGLESPIEAFLRNAAGGADSLRCCNLRKCWPCRPVREEHIRVSVATCRRASPIHRHS